MSRFHSYINSALEIISNYDGEKPFSFHIKSFFSSNKKYGSRDRKTISEICYCWFRTAWLFDQQASIENLGRSIFLCSNQQSVLLENISPTLNQKIEDPIIEKLGAIGKNPDQLFPFGTELGTALSASELALSYLQQPDLFLRTRPSKQQIVEAKLGAAKIDFERKSESSLSLPNGIKLGDILKINREVVIQDLNSQKVFDDIDLSYSFKGKQKVWDCCAASGGKSILFFDKVSTNIQLTVSDIRKSILHNCLERLQQASIPVHQHFIADLGTKTLLPISDDFDVIICDAPCTGSGTWGRTPEQLAFFDKKKIPAFASLQKSIVENAMVYLKEGGLFFYITCSVFKKENEDVVEVLHHEAALELIASKYLVGYHDKADTMFVSIFRKTSAIE